MFSSLVAAMLQSEKTAFDAVCKHPLTRILNRPMKMQQDKSVEEISNLALEFNVTNEWAGDYGLLTEIMGNGAYFLLTGKEYMKPTEPPKYPTNLDEDSTKDKRDRAIAALGETKMAYVAKKGFHRVVGANIRDALN